MLTQHKVQVTVPQPSLFVLSQHKLSDARMGECAGMTPDRSTRRRLQSAERRLVACFVGPTENDLTDRHSRELFDPDESA